jgi:integrase
MDTLTTFSLSLNDLFTRYKDEYVNFFGREKTVTAHRMKRLEERFGAASTTLHPAEVDRFFQSLASLSPASRNRYRSLLGHILRWGMERGLVDGGFPRLQPEPEHNERTRRLSSQEETQLAALMDSDFRLFFYAALDTGLRMGALRKLTGKDYFDGAIRVPASIQKHRRVQIIPLTRRLKEALAQTQPGPNEPLFPVYRFREKWDQLRKKTGCKDLHWHDLRGEFASRLSERKVPVEVVSKLLGHTSLTTTQRYLRPRVEAFQDAIDTLNPGD